MRLLFFIRCLPLAGLALLLVGVAAPKAVPDRLLTDTEIAGLERENAMWRLVRPGEEVTENLARIRAAGFTADEVAGVQPKLVALWDVPFERNFGWLRPETIEQVQAVDRRFIARMRATRLFEATGIRAGGQAPLKVDTLDRLWRGALLQVLGYDEIAEFRLMNSTSAREESRLVAGLTLSPDELRTLFEWRRQSDARRGPAPVPAAEAVRLREERLDEWQRIRELLGDGRFVTYLTRASQDFAQLREVLNRIDGLSPTAILDMWWLQQRQQLARSREGRARQLNAMAAEARTQAAKLIGESGVEAYRQEKEGRWLNDLPGAKARPVSTPLPAGN